jgi:nucleotide-binding universal stress UspA family protein
MAAENREPVRWSLRDAEAEFPISRDTLSKRLLQLGEQPGTDDKFSTKQVCAAVFGDREREQSRLAKEQADRIALDNAERRRTLIPVDDAVTLAGRFVFVVRQHIATLDITTDEKNAILADLQRLASVDFTKPPDEEEDAT